MIKFGKGNLRIPKWERPVYAVAGGLTGYRKRFPEYKLEELCMIAFRQMLEDNDLKLDPLEIKGLLNYAAYGAFADHFQDQLLCEAKVHDYLGLDPLFNTGIKTGGATGGSTVLNAAMAIASGYADVALAMGWERMDEVDTKTGNFYIATAACKDFETRLARIYASYYAPMARRFAWKYNLSEETRAKVAVKNRLYACYSPYAQQAGRHTVEEVLAGKIICDPLRVLECCCMSVGAACMLLCSEEMAYKLTDNPCQLFMAGGTHTLRVADRRHMEIPLLPHETPEMYRDFSREAGGDRWPGFESFLAARFAAYLVYRMAGIENPLKELDLVELHDAFTISDIQTYGDIG
ncbi:MAG: acetyl-CoA acetyltransferase, partial [Candidatus Portnoybacteria bacterium CG11_big_fil_rev_8_21_14_0_20_44_10]